MDFPYGEMLAVDHKQTFDFFVTELRDVSGDCVDQRQLLYTASILASYAQQSTECQTGFVTPKNLSEVFDQGIMNNSLSDHPDVMETLGALHLLFTGYFKRQMSRRHNISWSRRIGASFFHESAFGQKDRKKHNLLLQMSGTFDLWADRLSILSREHQHSNYIIGR